MLRSKALFFSGDSLETFSSIIENDHKPYLALKRRIAKAILESVEEGYTFFMCGLAKSFDLISACEVIELKETRKELMANTGLIAIIPYYGHCYTSPWQILHQLVLSRVVGSITLSVEYHPQVFSEQLRFMATYSSRVICYYPRLENKSEGAINYFRKQGLNVINVADD